MLSKHKVVSLISLAITVAFTFVTSVAMAAEFNVRIGKTEDASTDPGLQLLYPSADNILKIVAYFDQAVDLEKKP